MNKNTDMALGEDAAIDILRTDTALRYPVHNLSTNNDTIIQIQKRNDKGSSVFLWEVNHARKGSLPGRLAYQLDTLVVKRRIDEATYGGQPVPKCLRLGTLQEIAEELGLSRNTNAVRKALHENASAYLRVKGLTYQGGERQDSSGKTEYQFEFGDTRYGVVFTNQILPVGAKADAVYLVFHDLYLALLNQAERRPLDYEYLKELPPTAQRFYEILSYQMVPAIRYKQRAKLTYSEFCLLSTVTRYEAYEQVKKQMWKFHEPHKKAGYIEKVDFEAITDEEGRPDWNMLYTPGERAKTQQLVFDLRVPQARRPRSKSIGGEAKPLVKAEPCQPQAAQLALTESDTSSNSVAAQELVRRFYRERYEQEHTPTPKEITQADALLSAGEAWAAHLVAAAAKQGREKNGFPNDFGGIEKLAPQFRGDFAAQEKKQRAAQRENARKGHCKAHTAAYAEYLGQLLRGQLESSLPEAHKAFSEQEKSVYTYHKLRSDKSKLSAKFLEEFYDLQTQIGRLQKFIENNPKSGIPDFWQWDKTLNPAPYTE